MYFYLVEADEPLHLHITAPSEESLESATEQVESLLKHVKAQLYKFVFLLYKQIIYIISNF